MARETIPGHYALCFILSIQHIRCYAMAYILNIGHTYLFVLSQQPS
jgi:hypothetical protein